MNYWKKLMTMIRRIRLIQTALGEYGVTEIKGPRHNARILCYMSEAGFDFIDDETAWCSIFVNWVCFKAGAKMSGKANARSWLNVGETVFEPRAGDIVVFWRDKQDSWKGHVGFFVAYSEDGKGVYTLGGNQNNQVNITLYPNSKLLGFTRV